MDIGKSFSYVFEDPEWLNKILIGSLVFLVSMLLTPILVGILGFFIITGYALEVLANVRRGDPRPLPAWRDRWGEWLVLGLKLMVVTLVWALPAILLSIPMGIGGALTDSQGGEVIGGLLIAGFGCLVLIWSLLLLLVTPAIYLRLAETEDMGSALRFGEIIGFTRDNIGDVLIAVIVYFLASLVITLIGGMVGTLLCLVGLIITVPAASLYTMLVQSHLYAQVGLGTLDQRELEPA